LVEDEHTTQHKIIYEPLLMYRAGAPQFLAPALVAAAAAPRGPEIPHDQQQSQMVLLAPHQDGTKKGRRCSYATWSLDKLWAAFPWV